MKKLTAIALLFLGANLAAQDDAGQIDPVTADIVTDDIVLPDTPPPELDQTVETEFPEEQVHGAPVQEEQVPVALDENETIEVDVMTVTVPPDRTDEEELIFQYERYIELMNNSVYDEADSAAKRVVELAIKIRGADSIEFSKALTNLAVVQHHTRQFDAAQQNFESAIEIIENREDLLNEQLVNPLRGLGASQLEGGRPDKASSSFRRAVHVTHVNNGPHNLEQVEILDSLSETNLRLGNTEEAENIQDMIYALNEREYAMNAIGMIPSLMKRADWQLRAGFIYDQRVTLRRAVRIIEADGGKNDMRLVDPLTQLGQSFFYVDTSGTQGFVASSVSTGETYFKRALRIASENPDANWEMIAATSLSLGDYYMFLGNVPQADRIYRATWNDLQDGDARHAYRREKLERYTVLRSGPIPEFISPPSSEARTGQEIPLLQGSVTLGYDVSTRGRAANLRMVEAYPREFIDMQVAAQRELRRRIYRPEYDSGIAVSTDNQVLVHRFFYKQQDLDAARAAIVESQAEPEPESESEET